MAGNPLVDVFRIRDLRQRLIFTFAVLIVFRIGATIPIPGINVNALQLYYLTAQSSASGVIGFADYIDFFAGGGFKNFSVFMLGIMPYISMSIIMQLLILVFPKLKKISMEDGGRKKIARYTRYGTVIVCLIQSYAATVYARQIPDAVTMSRLAYSLIAIVTVTTGSMLLVWMGEQITQRGVGNGISLLIFAGIVARMPEAFIVLFGRIRTKDINPVFMIVVLAMFVVVIALVIYEQQGQRKIPVHYAKRVIGRKMYGGQSTYIPFKINPSGVIPVIFASSFMTFPAMLLQIFAQDAIASGTGFLYGLYQFSIATSTSSVGWGYSLANAIVYFLLIVGFTFFYTYATFNPAEVAQNINQNGGFIPGIRAGKPTTDYLTSILGKLTWFGAMFLSLIAILPMLTRFSAVDISFGGTGILIVVGVALETVQQLESQLVMRHYKGFLEK